VTVSATVSAIADDLRTAERTRVPIPPPTEARSGLTIDEAYAVQTANIALRIEGGEVAVGHKVGLTSEAMQRQLGVDQPDFGVITDAMVIADGRSLAVDELIAPRLEAEFAFLIGDPPPRDPTIDQVRASISAVATALEVIDSRVVDWRITLADTIADNASSARIVVGPWVPATPELLEAVIGTELALTRDGEIVAAGTGAAVLGDPVVALHWLARAIGGYGEQLAAGDVVLAGAVAASVALEPGHDWAAAADALGSVRMTSTTTAEETA